MLHWPLGTGHRFLETEPRVVWRDSGKSGSACVLSHCSAPGCVSVPAPMGFHSMKGWDRSVLQKHPGLSGLLELLDQSCRLPCPEALITVRGPSLPQAPAGAPGGGPDVANRRGCCQPGFWEGASPSRLTVTRGLSHSLGWVRLSK